MKELTDTEQKIVDAAATEFLKKGIAGARTQTIADLAGINKALLHYYFRSKEKLFEIVVERVIRRVLHQILGNISSEADFETWLKQFIHNYLTAISGNPMVTRFMLWEIEAGGGRIAMIFKEAFGIQTFEENPLYKVVNQAVLDGKIRPVDPIQFIISMLAVCIFPFVARPILEKIVPGLDIRSEEFLKQREEAVFDLIWNGVKPIEFSLASPAQQDNTTDA
jgi:TetR/AcrR family transcriptional regulator